MTYSSYWNFFRTDWL